jgi:hypothetical protein
MKVTDRFTQPQIESIYKLISGLNDCNTNPLSSCKIKGLSTYIDANNNFICTYVMESWGDRDGKRIEIIYRRVDTMGNTMDMLPLYSTEESLNKSISKMEKITL